MILIIVIIVMAIFVYKNSDTTKRDSLIKTTYADVKNQLQTGDILLFRYSNHANKAAQMIYFCRTRLVGSDYGHVAMVLRENGKLYAIEGVDIGHTAEDEGIYFNSEGKGGVRIIKLERLLERYHHDYGGLFAVRHTKKPISNKILMQTVLKYREQVFEDRKYLGSMLVMDYLSHGLANTLAVMNRTDKIFCSEFIYRVLRDCDLIGDYNPKLFWPALFTRPIFDRLTGKQWSRVVEFRL